MAKVFVTSHHVVIPNLYNTESHYSSMLSFSSGNISYSNEDRKYHFLDVNIDSIIANVLPSHSSTKHPEHVMFVQDFFVHIPCFL